MNPYGYIYIIRNNINQKLYVGQTTIGFDERYRNNIEKNTKNEHLRLAIQKYGLENFTIIKEFDIAYSKEELDKLEDVYIKIYNTYDKRYGYNKKFGGANGRHTEESKEKNRQAHIGKTWTEEQKALFSSKMSGENNPMYGIPSPMTGKKHSDETKEKIRQRNLGKKHTEETKEKMSKNHADFVGSKNGRAKAVICLTTGEQFDTVRIASIKYGLDESSIIKCCKGKTKSCGKHPSTGQKLIWKYKDGE